MLHARQPSARPIRLTLAPCRATPWTSHCRWIDVGAQINGLYRQEGMEALDGAIESRTACRSTRPRHGSTWTTSPRSSTRGTIEVSPRPARRPAGGSRHPGRAQRSTRPRERVRRTRVDRTTAAWAPAEVYCAGTRADRTRTPTLTSAPLSTASVARDDLPHDELPTLLRLGATRRRCDFRAARIVRRSSPSRATAERRGYIWNPMSMPFGRGAGVIGE